MILTTPAPERYTRCSCPPPPCAQCHRPGTGNIAHRSWTGEPKPIERLGGTACGRECSAREGTLMARTKLAEDTVERLLQCQRWGVCDEGTADSWGVELKTVSRCQRVATQRAQPHHQEVGHGMRRMPNCDRNRWHGSRPPEPGGVGSSWGLPSDHAHRSKRPRCSPRAWLVPVCSRSGSRMDGRRIRPHCSRAWGCWIVAPGEGGPQTPAAPGGATRPVRGAGRQGP